MTRKATIREATGSLSAYMKEEVGSYAGGRDGASHPPLCTGETGARVSVTDSKLTRATVCVEVYVKTNKRGKRRKGGKGGLCQALGP